MSEKSREEEKLSFKEQILRDLEKVKGYDEVLKEDEAVVRTPANEPSAEELMADSLSTVEEIMRKAPTVPTHPSQGVPASPADEIQRETPGVPSHPSQDVPSSPAEESGSRPGPGPVRPKKLEREYNETPTRVAVPIRRQRKKQNKQVQKHLRLLQKQWISSAIQHVVAVEKEQNPLSLRKRRSHM